MSDKPTLSGIIPPLLTPTDANENVDEPALRRFVDHTIEAGVNGLFIGGSAGEGPLLVERQWTRLAEIVFDQTRGRVPLLMGVQDCSTRKVLDKIRVAREIGYRFCVVTPTYYVPCRTAGEQIRLFGACAEAAAPSMELVAYNIPQITNSVVEVDTFCELAKRGWIRYCKESSGDLEYLRKLVARGGELGLSVLMGDERNAATGLRLGAKGLVNLCINIEPATYLALRAAVEAGRTEEADRCQVRINAIVDNIALANCCFIAGPKYVLAKRGFGAGKPLSPGEPIAAEQARAIDAFLQQA